MPKKIKPKHVFTKTESKSSKKKVTAVKSEVVPQPVQTTPLPAPETQQQMPEMHAPSVILKVENVPVQPVTAQVQQTSVGANTLKIQTEQAHSTNSEQAVPTIPEPIVNTVQPVVADQPVPLIDTVNQENSQPKSESIVIHPTISVPDKVTGDEFEPENKTAWGRLLLMFTVALVTGAAAVVGFYYYRQLGIKPATLAPVPTAVVSPAQPVEQTASESAETIDYSLMKVQILNGSGIAGQAAKVRDLISPLGITDFTLGNADSYDFKTTDIQLKKEVQATVYNSLKKLLVGYDASQAAELEATGSYDIIITVGSGK